MVSWDGGNLKEGRHSNMLKQSNTLPASKKVGANKLVMGFAALAATAVIGTTGVAAAAQNKPSKTQCVSAGFHNYGQCVKEWAHHKNHPGGGYGNTINVGVNVHGSNNIITIIINLFR
jgi:hypothetical protein